MQRTYLFVPPEENAELRSLGAAWDATSKRWYVESNEVPAKFARWLSLAKEEELGDEEFTIISDEAFVAAAVIPCQQCRTRTEVICIHCASGTVFGDPLSPFTVADIRTIDEDLARQLQAWPTYQRAQFPSGDLGDFTNHCSHCGAPQDDMYLHSEPDAPFFDIPHAPPGSIAMTPLVGTIRLSGDEHFTVE
jgi:hypothetical protein